MQKLNNRQFLFPPLTAASNMAVAAASRHSINRLFR
jgi:hypothetical protein